MKRVHVGDASISIDDTALSRLLDRATKGAASAFFEAAEASLKQTLDEALPLWPVRTGESKRSFAIERRVARNRLEVALVNRARNKWGAYAYKIRFSVRLASSLKQEAEDWAKRGDSPEAAAAIYRHRMKQLTRAHGKGVPSERLAGKRVWNWLILRPGRKRGKKLAVEIQQTLDKLAR